MKLKIPKQKTFTGPALIWKRMLAFFIDLLVINFIILFPFKRLFQRIVPSSLSFEETFSLVNDPGLSSMIVATSVFVGILMVSYFMILEGKLGQSIGKILVNIYVASEIKEMRFWQLLVRSLFLMPVFPFILLWIMDPVFMFFTKDNKRLSEILSKTKVVGKYQY